MSGAETLARVVVGTARAVVRRMPTRLKKALDDRLFGAIFQVTRVTNDAYGWRPSPPTAGQAADDDPGAPPPASG